MAFRSYGTDATTFDRPYPEVVDNDEIYNTTVHPLISTIFNRCKVTCFAYGQTERPLSCLLSPILSHFSFLLSPLSPLPILSHLSCLLSPVSCLLRSSLPPLLSSPCPLLPLSPLHSSISPLSRCQSSPFLMLVEIAMQAQSIVRLNNHTDVMPGLTRRAVARRTR